MEEQEKIDIKEHLIGWIDTLLEDGIVPQVVNPKAIKANYIPKSKIKEKIEEIKEYDKKYKTYTKDGRENYTMRFMAIPVLQELLEEK